MSDESDLVCPACGEDDDLTGTRQDDETILITCGACGTEWVRDPRPRCDRCGGDDVEAAVKAVVERSRGTQLSIVGTQVVHLCRDCDRDVLASYRVSRSPLMPDELPTVGPEQA